MTLRRWDIVVAPISENDRAGHPAIVLSAETRLGDERIDRINVLVGTKKQPAESVLEHHVVLNGADGLDFAMKFDCGFVYVLRKKAIRNLAGSVSYARRTQIQSKLRAFLGLG